MWEKRNCLLPAISPFPTMFSKGYFLRVVKSLDCDAPGKQFDENGRKLSKTVEKTSVFKRLVTQGRHNPD